MGRTLEQRAMQAALVAGTARGDRASFEALYDEFADLVYSIAMSMLRDPGRAEDAAQDAWVRIWNGAGSFDPERASAATWITTIAHRQVIDVLRRQRARPADALGREPGDEVAAREDAGSDTAGEAITTVTVETIRGAMRELPEMQRVALELAYFEGLTQSEIAARLSKPLGTITTYMFQGMRKLRVQLAPDDAAQGQE
jgi:RNA polymerase sigma-70 factor (ECF subfamily)